MGSPTAPYRLQFVPQAKAEWDALDGSIRTQIDGAQKPKAPTHKTPSSSIHYPIDRVQKLVCAKALILVMNQAFSSAKSGLSSAMAGVMVAFFSRARRAMLMAALWSRSCVLPQPGQVQTCSARSAACTKPQA